MKPSQVLSDAEVSFGSYDNLPMLGDGSVGALSKKSGRLGEFLSGWASKGASIYSRFFGSGQESSAKNDGSAAGQASGAK